MRSFILAIALVGALSMLFANQATHADEGDRQPQKPGCSILLTEGIVGGFAPAHVRSQVAITRSGDAYQVLVMTHPARNAQKTFRVGKLTEKQIATLLNGLEKQGLWKLPIELPSGCQDIYAKDTSLAVMSGKHFWRNGGPGGCVRGKSKVQPTGDDQKTFVELIGAVKKLAMENAKGESDAKTFQKVVRAMHANFPRPGKGGRLKPADQ